MAFEAVVDRDGVHRVVLEWYPWGVFVLVFRSGHPHPYRDHLQDDWDMAFRQAKRDFGLESEQFTQIPDLRIM